MDILRSHSARRRRLNQIRINLFTGLWLSALYAMLVFCTVSFGFLLLSSPIPGEGRAAVRACPSSIETRIETRPQENEEGIQDCIRGLLPSYPCKQLVNP